MNLAATLRRRATEAPAHPAILFEGATIPYGELDARASRLAHALRAHGIGPADRVALYLPNVPDFAVAYYATQLLGAITVSINAIFKAAEVEYLLNDSGAAVVLTLAELVASCRASANAIRLFASILGFAPVNRPFSWSAAEANSA